MAAGSLFIIAAPSGAGKSSLVNALLADETDIQLSVSWTTRPPRPGEEHGREYHFCSTSDFLVRKQAGEFLESAEVHGNYYGTSRIWINEQIRTNHDVLLEIDWQGARQVRQAYPQAISIFILPPSIAVLAERLRKRGQDEPHIIERRLLAAGGEIAHATDFDYVIINDNFSAALVALKTIVHASRQRFSVQAARYTELFIQLGIHA